jgi:hypothetical protein
VLVFVVAVPTRMTPPKFLSLVEADDSVRLPVAASTVTLFLLADSECSDLAVVDSVSVQFPVAVSNEMFFLVADSYLT